MPYEPRPGSKIDGLLAAMREQRAARPIWTQDEAAKVMNVPRAQVPTYIASACNGQAMFRRTVQGGIELSLDRFPTAPPPAYEPYTPKPLEVPRFGSDQRLPSRAPGEPPAPSPAAANIAPPAAQHVAAMPAVAPPPTSAPTPDPVAAAPAAVKATTNELDDDSEDEPVKPNAFVDVGSGDVVLVGCEVDEEGRVTVPGELVRRIVGRMAWSPVR